MKFSILCLAVCGFAAAEARAEFSFACGEGKDHGVEVAEVGLMDSLEAPMKLLLKGHAVDDEKLGVKPVDTNLWIATVDLGEGKGTRRFEFSVARHSVQEFFTSASGKDKKVGASRDCLYKQWEPQAEGN